MIFSQCRQTHTPPGWFTFAGHVFNLQAYEDTALQAGYGFQIPIIVWLSYDPAALSGESGDLEVRYWDAAAGAWSSDGITLVAHDPVNHTVTVTVQHLTEFALLQANDYGTYLPVVLRQ